MQTVREVRVILLGLGNVGRVLLRQILETRAAVAQRVGLRLVLIALADVSGALIDPAGLPEDALQTALQTAMNGQLLNTLPRVQPLDKVAGALAQNMILADVTASPHTNALLQAALAQGSGIVLANKIPLAGTWSDSNPFFEYPRLRYEVTVGAGLPVIGTLSYLLDTGDRITAIEGCLSGTLGYLCAELERGVPYSAAVTQARALGYTEPDPRDDLGGRDVARKALILARTAGWPLEMDHLTVEALYPESLAQVSTEVFMAALPSEDAAYSRRVEAARAEDGVLRYVARVGPEGGQVGLVTVPHDGPLGALRGPGNYIAFYTHRYDALPLVISGPGAGPEVTAAGVLGDLIALGQQMG